MEARFPALLLNWYAENARDLPWRGSGDPYAVWVSEIMLQQTRVETVIPYFQRWMRRFPNVQTLASAPLSEVLKAWEGLGYYARARNLHRAAQQIVAAGGGIPRTVTALRALPGIGEYTAAAIAALAFGTDTVALDGNVRRVLARLFNVDLPARSAEGERRLRALAQAHLPPGQAADFNQALMDLGATICTPHRPACAHCPLARLCKARELGIQEARPVQKTPPATPHYVVTAAVIQREGRVLLGQRPPQGLLGGLWEFPGGKQEPGETLTECLRREIDEELGLKVQVGHRLGTFRHAYTHFRVTLHAFFCQAEGNASPRRREHTRLTWAHPSELAEYPMGKLDRMIATALQTGGP